MKASQTPNWQPVTMIPLFVELAKGMLGASEDQLNNMEQTKGKSHILDDETVWRIIKLHNEQNENVSHFLEQCRRWRKQKLNAQKEQWVDQIESNVKALKKINQQILFLTNHYKDGTIDKILQKDDIELALDILGDKIDPP